MAHLPPELVMGVPSIDAAHEEFYANVLQFADAVTRGTVNEALLRSYLAFLLDYTVTHFREEEALMLKEHFPALRQHREEHIAFWHLCLKVQEHCEGIRYGHDCAMELLDQMDVWFWRHVSKADRAFVEFMKALDAPH